MNNTLILLKVRQRLNKLSSADYDNVPAWQIIEAFNKGTVNWCRRNLHGMNTKQEGDEQSKRRIDDLQILLTETPVTLSKKDLYLESDTLPDDYMEWKRISAKAKDDCCDDNRNMIIYLAEEGNVDTLLRDKHKQPNFEWAETFCTLKSNRVRIYTNNKFTLVKPILSYYRQPVRIQILGEENPYTQLTSIVEVESEFKDDLVELFVDEAVKILAGDIESMNQKQTATSQVEGNN